MQHLFVNYDLALKLKEAGFDEPCLAAYEKSGNFYPRFGADFETDEIHVAKNSDRDITGATAPIYQQVFDWLEGKGLWLHDLCSAPFRIYSCFIYDDEQNCLWPGFDPDKKPLPFATRKQSWDWAIEEALQILKRKS